MGGRIVEPTTEIRTKCAGTVPDGKVRMTTASVDTYGDESPGVTGNKPVCGPGGSAAGEALFRR